MPTPSIRLTDDLHHAAKHSDTSISKMARQGIEQEIISEMVGVCWVCGSGIMANEQQETGGFSRLDQPVQVCSRCLDDFEAYHSGHRNAVDEPYLRQAYDSENLYDISPSRLPELGVAYAIESTAVWDTSYYRYVAGDDDGSYWAAKSRNKGIVSKERIPLVEIALRNHAISLASGGPTLDLFRPRLRRATKRAEESSSFDRGPPGAPFSFDEVLEEMVDSKLATLTEDHCPACGVATGRGTGECDVCFHRWEYCPDSDPNPMHSQCSGSIVYTIDTSAADSSDWLLKHCSDCGNHRQVVTDDSVKEEFRQRYLRIFDELRYEHPDIDKNLLSE
jgi:hypothetical protein